MLKEVMNTPPTPFPDLLARATKGPFWIKYEDNTVVESPTNFIAEAENKIDAELIRRALAFFAAGGYEELKDIQAECDYSGFPAPKLDVLLRILDGVDEK